MPNPSLRNKSDMLIHAAELLHRQSYYLAVAHAAYYSCFQLLEYIWLYSMAMGKFGKELNASAREASQGVHVFLLNEVARYIAGLEGKDAETDARTLRNKIPQLKHLRTEADYKETVINSEKSKEALDYSRELLPILTRYL